MVSIILPTYNRGFIITEAIQSIINQTFSEFELLIIDDGSTDNTEQIIKKINDKRIRYIKLEQNQGVSNARNIGIEHAMYKYIAFQDSDDLWLPDKLEKQVNRIEQSSPAVGFIYHSFRYDFGDGHYAIVPDIKLEADKKRGNIFSQMLYDNMIGAPTLLVRKSCIDRTGRFNTTWKCLEDYDFALRLTKEYEAEYIDEALLVARHFDNSISTDSFSYIVSSCKLVATYKKDFIAAGMLNHRLEIILRDAEKLNISDRVIPLLENIMKL